MHCIGSLPLCVNDKSFTDVVVLSVLMASRIPVLDILLRPLPITRRR